MSVYDDILAERKGTKLRSSLYTAADANPEEEAFFSSLSEKTGLPVEALRNDRGAEGKRLQTVQQADTLLTQAPQTAAWMANQDNARHSHDDTENLAQTEALFVKRKGEQSTLGMASAGDQALAKGAKKAAAFALPTVAQSFKTLPETIALGVNEAEAVASEWLGITALLRATGNDKGADYFKNYNAAMSARKESLETVKPQTRAQANFKSASDSISLMLATAPAAIAGRIPQLAAFAISAPGQLFDYIEAGYHPVQAAAFSAMNKVMEGATEMIGVGKLFQPGSFAKKASGFVVGDLFGEQINNSYAKLNAKGTLDPDMTLEEFTASAVDTAVVTIMAGGIQGAATAPLAAMSGEYQRAAKAQQNMDFMLALGDSAKSAKLLQRMPAKYKEFIQAIKAQGDVENVFIDADKFQTFFQSQGVDPQQMAESIGAAEEYAQALAVGGEMVIPLEDYAMHLAGTDYHTELSKDLRLHPDVMSYREAEKFKGEIPGQLDSLLKEVTDGEGETASKKVYDDIYQGLTAVGRDDATARFEALIQTSRVNTLAEQQGRDAWEIWQENPIKFKRETFMARKDFIDTTVDPLLDRLRGKEAPAEGKVREVLDAIDREMRGDPLYSDKQTDNAALQMSADLEEMQMFLDQNNIDLATMSNLEIRDALAKVTGETFNQSVDDYAGEHRPPGPEDGAPLHDLTGGGDIYPADIYSSNGLRYYGTGEDKADRESMSVIQATKGKKNAVVTIYRAIPKVTTNQEKLDELLKQMAAYQKRGKMPADASFNNGSQWYNWAAGERDRLTALPEESAPEKVGINSGDWVTLSRTYAKDHGEGALNGKYRIISKKVKASELFTNGDSINEFGYWKDGKQNPNILYQPGSGKIYTEKEMESMDIDELDRLAFGVNTGDIIDLDPSQINIKYEGDLENPEDKFAKGGMEWAKSVDLSEPVQVRVEEDGKFYLEDGHHRWFAAQKTGRKVKAEIEVNGNPVRAILKRQSQSYEQRMNDDKRASITFLPTHRQIELFKGADASSVIHEFSHSWLEELKRDGQAGVNEQVKSDWEIAARHIGIDPAATSIPVEAHEKFADTGIAYVAEGQAPSVELIPVFQRFKAQLALLYKRAKIALLPMNDEIRGVFDRLLASKEQTAEARRQQGFVPLILTAESAGMTERGFAAYRKAMERAHVAAEDHLQQVLMREMAREDLVWWKEAEAKMKEEVTAEAQQEPIYDAFQALSTGKTFAGDDAPDGFKIDRSALEKTYGKEWVKKLPRWFKKGIGEGMHPDEVAEVFGFSSGDDMIQQMINALPFRQFIDAETSRRMLRDHGDMMTDGRLPDEAMQAVHTDMQAEVLHAELKALKTAERQSRPAVKAALQDAKAEARAARDEAAASLPPLDAFRTWAAQAVGNMPVGKLRPSSYLRAERKAANAAQELYQKQKFAEAAEEKQKQIANMFLYREAVKAQEEVNKSLNGFKKIFKSDDKMAKGRDLDLVNAARSILGAYEIGPKNGSALSYLTMIQQYNPALYADLQMAVDVAMQEGKSYKTLTFDEFLAMKSAVENLMHMARRDKVVEIEGKSVLIEDAVTDLVDDLLAKSKGKDASKYATAGNMERASLKFAGVRAAMRRIESWVSARDGGKAGVFRRYLWQSVSDAAVNYRLAKADHLKRFRDLFDDVKDSLHSGAITAHELGAKGSTFRNKAELLMAVLHTGNMSNKKKLLVGRGWGAISEHGGQEGLDSYQWDAFIRRMWDEKVLTEKDYKFMQGVWDLLEEIKPQAQAAHHKMYGYYFSEITAQEVNTPWGTFRGGYVPAVTDPFKVQDQASREDIESFLNDNQTSMFPTPSKGFTMARTEYNKELSLDMSLLPSHLDKVLKFVHLAAPVRDVAKIVTNRDFREAMNSVDPTAIDDMLLPWLNRAGRQTVETKSTGWAGKFIDDVARGARRRTGIQLMVLNVANTLQQFTGISLSLQKVKARNLAGALWQYSRHPGEVADMIITKSAFMRDRMTGETHRLMGEINLLLDESKLAKAQDYAMQHGYVLQIIAQNMVDAVTWTGAYNQSIGEGADEITAVRAADSAVRETQGSFAAEDISRMETGTARARLFTQFMSYFNMQANLLGTKFQNIVEEYGWRGGSGRLFMLYFTGFMIPAVLSELIMRAAAGRLDDDDDDEMDLLAIFFGGQYKTGMAMIPGGQVVTAAVNRWNKNPSDDRLSVSPVVAALESIGGASYAGYEAITEGEINRRGVKDVMTALGLATGLPLGAVARPVGYGVALERGDTEPENGLDAARGFMTGYAPRR